MIDARSLRAKNLSRAALARMPRGGATVSECARRRESVGTDSRVLHRREAVDAPVKPFCAKFFWHGESVRRDAAEPAKIAREGHAARVPSSPHRKIGVARNPRFIGTFAQRRFLRA
jgi:hypothetical protein